MCELISKEATVLEDKELLHSDVICSNCITEGEKQQTSSWSLVTSSKFDVSSSSSTSGTYGGVAGYKEADKEKVEDKKEEEEG